MLLDEDALLYTLGDTATFSVRFDSACGIGEVGTGGTVVLMEGRVGGPSLVRRGNVGSGAIDIWRGSNGCEIRNGFAERGSLLE